MEGVQYFSNFYFIASYNLTVIVSKRLHMIATMQQLAISYNIHLLTLEFYTSAPFPIRSFVIMIAWFAHP